jgi:hypothetical protein
MLVVATFVTMGRSAVNKLLSISVSVFEVFTALFSLSDCPACVDWLPRAVLQGLRALR